MTASQDGMHHLTLPASVQMPDKNEVLLSDRRRLTLCQSRLAAWLFLDTVHLIIVSVSIIFSLSLGPASIPISTAG